MEPEPGNANEAEGTLNPGVTRGPDGQLYLFRGSSRAATIRASALHAFGSTTPAIRAASNGSALRSSPRLSMSGAQTVAEAARIRASRFWNHTTAT